MGSLQKERMIHVLKKLASLLLSLLLCLSLLPGQAGAADTTEGVPPVPTESSEAEHPDDPHELLILTAVEFPEEENTKRVED